MNGAAQPSQHVQDLAPRGLSPLFMQVKDVLGVLRPPLARTARGRDREGAFRQVSGHPQVAGYQGGYRQACSGCRSQEIACGLPGPGCGHEPGRGEPGPACFRRAVHTRLAWARYPRVTVEDKAPGCSPGVAAGALSGQLPRRSTPMAAGWATWPNAADAAASDHDQQGRTPPALPLMADMDVIVRLQDQRH